MPEGNTESPIEYVSRKQIPELVDGLMLKVIDARPEDPRSFMAAVLAGAPPPVAKEGKVQLFLMRLSVNCHGPWVLLRQAKVEYELRDTDLTTGENKKPAFLEMNPVHTVPTVRDADGTCVWESNAVMRYICNKYQQAAKYYPQDLQKRAHCDMAMDWRQSNLYKNISGVAYRKFGWMPPDAAAEAACRESLTNPDDGCFAVLEKFFLNGKPFICGDEPTIADFSIAPSFGFLDASTDIEIPPAIAAYRKRFDEAVGYEEVFTGAGGFGTKAFVETQKNKPAAEPEKPKEETKE
eukprot:TRINITY_DN15117_c0_g1_i1.p1 TRINITY_DN15117_c0_g1~~TRINITY_DN15117_c0_g1_i1.p1  ORF type:complete len:294 (+),score=41.47 TRINITY_DN15117_c0_g1_i1:60-941(+)